MDASEQEFKRIADWLVMQSRLEGHVPPKRSRAFKRPSVKTMERARKQAVVASLIAKRRGNG